MLAQRGVPVRALVRDLEKAVALAQAGAEIVVGDFDDQVVEGSWKHIAGGADDQADHSDSDIAHDDFSVAVRSGVK